MTYLTKVDTPPRFNLKHQKVKTGEVVKPLPYSSAEEALEAWKEVARKENAVLRRHAPTPNRNLDRIHEHPSRDKVVACLKATHTPLTVREVAAITGVTVHSATHIIRGVIYDMLTVIPEGRAHKYIIEDDKETV